MPHVPVVAIGFAYVGILAISLSYRSRGVLRGVWTFVAVFAMFAVVVFGIMFFL